MGYQAPKFDCRLYKGRCVSLEFTSWISTADHKLAQNELYVRIIEGEKQVAALTFKTLSAKQYIPGSKFQLLVQQTDDFSKK